MSRVNKTRFLVQHESCDTEGKCMQKWNNDKCQCESEELDNWSSCKDDYTWNPSICDWECNQGYKIDKYLDIKYCSCKKCLFGKLVLACEDGYKYN